MDSASAAQRPPGIATRQVRIESIAAGGDGVARAEGLAVFVPRTAPGDVAEVRVTTHGRLGRGQLIRLVSPGPARIAPQCGHYDGDQCGGCQLQHIDYGTQLDAKQRIVADAFRRIARRDVALPEIVPSPTPWGYRSKLTLTMRRSRGNWTMGLHALDDPSRVFALRECPITDRAVVSAWREVADAATVLPPEPELRGSVRRVADHLAFVLEGGTRWDTAREFVHRCPSLHLIRWHPVTGPPRILVDRRPGGGPAASFEQVNPVVAVALRADLVRRALAVSPGSAVDAYAGSGATAAALAAAGVRVTAIEVDEEAAAFARRHLPDDARVLTARVEHALEAALPADVVVLNPPRAGVDRRVTGILAAAHTRLVLYASCDPATLARDVSRLPGYRVTFLKAFDMFPQTAHVETLCELTPEAI